MFGFGKLNLAVIGTGYMAGVIADSISSAGGIKPYAVVSRDVENAVAFGREHGFKKAYDSIEEMLSDKKVNLVYVATPSSEHYEAVRLCIEYAKPVLCETPMTLTASKAEELFSLASSQNVLVVEAMYTRFLPLAQQISNVLSSKVIGDPVMLNASIASDIGNIPRLQRPELGGGALGDLGIYLLNFASMVFGDDVKRIHSSCVFASTGVDRQDSITLQYKDGKMAVLSCTMNGNGESRAVIQGTKGYIVVDDIRNFEFVTVYNSSRQKTATYKRTRQKTGYEFELRAFVAALKSNWLECPEMPHAQTESLLHMMDYIRRQLHISYAPVRAVPLPGVREEAEQLGGQNSDVIQAAVTADAPAAEELAEDTAGSAPAEEVKEETAENAPAEEVAEETAESAPAEEVVEETAESAPAEEVAEETAESAPAEEVAEETAESAPAEEVAEDTTESAPAEEVVEETAESAPVEDTAADLIEEAGTGAGDKEPAAAPPAEKEPVSEPPAEQPVEEVPKENTEEEDIEEDIDIEDFPEGPSQKAIEDAARESVPEGVEDAAEEQESQEAPVEEQESTAASAEEQESPEKKKGFGRFFGK